MDNLTETKLEIAKLRTVRKSLLGQAFDAFNIQSRPNPVQADILTDTKTLIFWLLGGNRSGKSQTGGRVVSWWFEEAHPYMSRPPEWGTAPLQMLVVGRLGEQLESELWEKKIKPFLTPGTYSLTKIGNILQRVTSDLNGNRIIFLSHHDALNAREKVQAFTSQVVWLDEMPDYAGLITELVMRAIAARGRLYATFTPLLKNEAIRRIVDTETSSSRKIQLSMLDNPIYRGREEEIIETVRAACSSESEFRARMYGDWYAGSQRVFSYDMAANRADPVGYSVGWRHIAVCDPAASGLTGLVVWAEDPTTGSWFNIKAKYIKGSSAFELLDAVEAELVGLGNLTRICDCNPAGFYKEAARRGVLWVPYTEKNDRKLETIDKTNHALNERRLFLTSNSGLLEEELVSCAWSESNPDKIVGSSRYHLADPTRYFVDRLPEWDPTARVVLTETQALRHEWKEKQAATRMSIVERRKPGWSKHSWRRSLHL